MICLALIAIVPADALHLKKKLLGILPITIPIPTITINKPEVPAVKPELPSTTHSDSVVVESGVNVGRYQPVQLQYLPYYQPIVSTGIPLAAPRHIVYSTPLVNPGLQRPVSYQSVLRYY